MINNYLLGQSDWLIAIFKDKFGTSTGKAESGTLEEIELFLKFEPRRPVSIYFYLESQNEKVRQYKKQW